MASERVYVVHGNGGTQGELFLLIFVPVIGMLLRNLAVPYLSYGIRWSKRKDFYLKMLVDFVCVVVPMIATQTILVEWARGIAVVMLIFCAIIFFFMVSEQSMFTRDNITLRQTMNRMIEEHHSPTTFLTYLRSLVFLLVAVAILAVDFGIFPRRFAKTEKYGHSLMDIGVAAFIIANALIGPLKTGHRLDQGERLRASRRFPAVYSSTVILVALGAGRTLILALLGYPYEVSEYGVHWNFFYTLAAVTLATYVLPTTRTLVTATILAVGHQIALGRGLEEWIMDDAAPRDGLFEANREGICSLAGYLAIFYYARALGRFIRKTVLSALRLRSWAECSLHLAVISLFALSVQWGAEWALGPPSRRLVNLPYILSMVSMASFILAATMAVQVVQFTIWAARLPNFGSEENPWATHQPCLLEIINKYPLIFFIVSNLSTGIVNLSCHWILGLPSCQVISAYPSLVLLTLHCLVSCGLVAWLEVPPPDPEEDEEDFDK